MSITQFPDTRSEWGQAAQRICAHVLDGWRALPDDEQTEARLRAMLREAYPWGRRENQPYQMWLKQQQVTFWLAGFGDAPAWVIKQHRGPGAYIPPKEQLPMDLDAR